MLMRLELGTPALQSMGQSLSALRFSALRTHRSALFSGVAVSVSLMTRPEGEGKEVKAFHYFAPYRRDRTL